MTKRWKPRFSLRTLVIFVTLVCVYFGAWEATKRWGAKKYGEPVEGEPDTQIFTIPIETSPLPFLVQYDDIRFGSLIACGPGSYQLAVETVRNYDLWLFGWRKRLCERSLEIESWRLDEESP